MSSLLGSVPILVVVAAVQLLLISNVSSLNLTNSYLHHKCNNTQGKYKQGSVFEKNFNILRTDLFKGNFSTGFRYDQKGDYPNTVFAMFQCRGDSYWDKCRSCITTAFSGLRRRCPGNKGAIIWYDQCFLKIFTTDTYNKIDYENDYYLSNAKNVSGNPELFNKEVSALLENLTIKATTTVGKKPSLYAAGEKRIGTKKLYAMVQCAQDLVSNACHACLEWSFKKFPECCNGKQGGRVLGGSCNFRYELYPFLRN